MPRRRFDDDDEGFWTPAAGRDYNVPFTYRLGRFLQSLGGTMGGAEDRQQGYLESFIKMQRDEAEEQRRRKLAEETSRHNLAQEKLTQKRLEDVDAEREAARQERAATQQAGVLSQGLFRRQPTEVRTGVPTPEPLRAPGEGGVSVRQELRRPELDEVLEKATEQRGVTPGVIQALSRLYKERFPEAAPKAPKQHVVGGALVDETGNVIYRSPEKAEKAGREPNPTEVSLALQAAGGDPVKAMEILRANKAAGATNIKVDAGFKGEGERKDFVSRGSTLETLDELEEIASANPDFFGGAFGVKGGLEKGKSWAGMGKPGFADFNSKVSKLRADLINQLAGAAIGPAEAQNYLASVPGIGFGMDSSEQFMANIRATRGATARIQRRAIELQKMGPGALDAEYAKLGVKNAAELKRLYEQGEAAKPKLAAPGGKAIRSIRPLP